MKKINKGLYLIRLGTTFSGIGAVEHAFDRLSIPYKIVFACDNGGVDLFNKKIEDRFQPIQKEIDCLKKHINELSLDEIQNFKETLFNTLETITMALKEIENSQIKLLDTLKLEDTIIKVLNHLEKQNDTKFSMYYDISKLDASDYLFLTSELKNYLKKKMKNDLITDINQLEKISKDKQYRFIRRKIKAIVKQLSQLHGTIGTLETLNNLKKIKSFSEKKAYVDALYKDKEKSNFVKKSYLANYSIDEKDFHWNISFLDGHAYKNKIDLYVGGSPCQSFSIVGKRGGFEDTRGTLFYDYVRIIKETQPRFFIYENVKGVLSHDGGQTWEVMKNVFHDTGYDFKTYVLNARDFGIPQNRERLFVVGFKDKKDFNAFKDPKKKKLEVKMSDFLEDTVEEKYFLADKGITFVTDSKNISKKYTQINGDVALCQKANQQFNWHGDFIEICTDEELDSMSKIDQKYFISDKVKKYILDDLFFMNRKPSEELMDLDIARPLTASMHKMHRAGVDNYISYGKKLPASERMIRKLTPRECFRLMGFCDSFKHVVSDTQLYQQAGNSIVVDVLMEIIKELNQIK